jgi:Rhs element Vgr protein
MSVVTVTITSGNAEMDPRFEVVSVDVSREVDRIPEAQVVLIDGDAARRKFAISDTAFFEPGKEVEIKLRYEGETKDASVFKGPVVRHGAEAGRAGSVLVVEAKDAAIKLTRPRRSAAHRDLTDGEVIGMLLRQAGLRAGKIPATQPKHAQLVQYNASDWDFILSRADVLGLVVVVDSGTVSLASMAVAGAPALRLEYGMNEIFNFEIMLDASRQPEGVESVAWDQKTQKATQRYRAKAVALAQGNLNAAKVAATLGPDEWRLVVPAPLDPKELQSWADARLARSRLSMIRGRVAIPGSASVKPMDVVELAGIGARFNGKALVTGVRHRVDAGGWQTDLQLGLSPDWYCRRDHITEPPAAGLLPAVQSLCVGVVDQFEADPDKEFRVRVLLPTASDKPLAVWARLASPDAGKARGYFFRPDPGDEVVVGFFNNDPRQPVVLGALFGSKNAPPQVVSPLTDKNIHKAIVTKKGTAISFIDDDKPSVSIQTPGKNKITIDDNDESVKIEDQHGNSITLNKNGIAIKSAKDLTLEASGNVEIKGAKVDVK